MQIKEYLISLSMKSKLLLLFPKQTLLLLLLRITKTTTTNTRVTKKMYLLLMLPNTINYKTSSGLPAAIAKALFK